jgi:hypothetical protein
MPANSTSPEEQDGGLPPPGSRWGAGAQSVLPYLTKTLQSKPSEAPQPRDARDADAHEKAAAIDAAAAARA